MIGAGVDLAANRAEGRSWGESAGRTAMSAGVGGLAGVGAGVACGAVSFGLLAAACGVGAGAAGSAVGQEAGDYLYVVDLEVLDTGGGLWLLGFDPPEVELAPTSSTAVFRRLAALVSGHFPTVA